MELDLWYETMLGLIKEAGELILDKTAGCAYELKSCDVDLVTEIDKGVENLLIRTISVIFPDHKFIGEETVSDGGKCELTDSPTWVIDPVDGTMNLVHGFPHSSISVALLVNKVTELAFVYNPIIGQLFTARKGQGAFLNGKPIHVSKQTKLSKALITFETGTSRDTEKMRVVFENFRILTQKAHGIRCLGSAALNMCMVALGGADANFEFGIHVWDIAAGDLIVREAGGVCIDPAGGPLDLLSRRVLCASSQELANQLVDVLVQWYTERD